LPDLVVTLLWLAEDLEKKHYPFSGAIRQGARRIAELEAIAPSPHGCRRCGKPLVQRSTGRPRVWCSERCRRRKVSQRATYEHG
jgi:ribosomal protein L37AE/L43A